MAYDEGLADRIREIVSKKTKRVEEKKMFGGLCFMVNGKMCVTTREDHIMVRLAPDEFEKAREVHGFKPMEHNGRTMTGFGYVDRQMVSTKKELEHWVDLALEYNEVVNKKPVKKTPRQPAQPAAKKRPAAGTSKSRKR